jgi:RNA polymerase sigma-70 factor (ECF subfamily)
MTRPVTTTTASHDELTLRRLLDGDRRAYDTLVRRHHDAMLRLARCYVHSQALAEEVVQETWAAVLEGLPRFQGRSSIKTWIFAILINRAKSLGVRERRSVPFSSLGQRGDPALEATDSELLHDLDGAHTGRPDEQTPERALEVKQQLDQVQRVLAQLSPAQRDVVTSIGVLGNSATETCEQLAISSANQRVLLHRGRSRLRAAMSLAA